MIYAGIDPGLDGAVAFLFESGHVEFYDTPSVQLKRRDYDLPAMVEILQSLSDMASAVLVGLEKVHSMPGQGVASMFSFGGGFKAWEMALVCLRLPYELVSPERWKKAMMDGQTKDKDSSRIVAARLFPQSTREIKLKKHHGRADALLIAEYLRRSSAAGRG